MAIVSGIHHITKLDNLTDKVFQMLMKVNAHLNQLLHYMQYAELKLEIYYLCSQSDVLPSFEMIQIFEISIIN